MVDQLFMGTVKSSPWVIGVPIENGMVHSPSGRSGPTLCRPRACITTQEKMLSTMSNFYRLRGVFCR
jgi:hypothetical protein